MFDKVLNTEAIIQTCSVKKVEIPKIHRKHLFKSQELQLY